MQRPSADQLAYTQPQLYINGQWLGIDGRQAEDVINPATGAVLARLPHATPADLDAALTAAQRARQAGMGIAIPYYLWDWGAEMEPWRGRDLRAELSALDEQIATAFTDLQTLLDAQRKGDGFATYDELSEDQVKELSDAVNALGEPLSKMAGAILK